ncbi:MAG: hypothetical protein ACMUHM_09415, partial [Thermoplasmatota archaeon]
MLRGLDRAMAMTLCLLMLGGSFLLSDTMAEDPPTRDGEGNDPYCTFNGMSVDSTYIGGSDDFYVRVYNEYN